MQDPFESDREERGVNEQNYCPECEHAIPLHADKYGCQHERGDSWVTGKDGTEALVAMGPCGCKAVEPFQRLLEAHSIALEVARAQERDAYVLLKEAEKHLAHANDYWEQCCTVLRMLKPAN